MAQRFAIDGNFTQSFVGTINLNAHACPSNNTDDFASLFYDLDTGTVCYITASTDFCYEFFFDSENTIAISKAQVGDAEQAFPPAQSFQFVGDGGGGPIGSLSQPKTRLDRTEFIMLDSASINAGGIKNYLIQNTESGSLKLSTPTNAVQINYTAQAQTGSLGNKIILGNPNNIPTASNPQFTVLTTTNNEPFTHGEKVCVEILTSGGGGSSTTYQTGSSVLTQLTNLQIIDFDSNVFVTSDPITGQLTLQFGSPALPVISSFTVPTAGTSGNTSFFTDRFSGPGTPPESSIRVVDNDYRMIFQFATASSNEFLSASVEGFTDGDYEILETSTTYQNGNITFNISNFNASDQKVFSSGSHQFRGVVHVKLEDGSLFTTRSAVVNPSIDKLDPNIPTYTDVAFTVIGASGGSGTDFVSNTGNNADSVTIEKGVTGSVAYKGAYGSNDRGWSRTSISPALLPSRSITQTNTNVFVTATATYNSNGLGTNAAGSTTTSVSDFGKATLRVKSLRYAALPAGTFASNLSPTNDELLDIVKWVSNGGTIDFLTNTSSEINGETFNITWSGQAYVYIIMDTSVSLSQINVDGFGSISAFTTGTTADYRFYVTTGIQNGGTGTTAAYELIT